MKKFQILVLVFLCMMVLFACERQSNRLPQNAAAVGALDAQGTDSLNHKPQRAAAEDVTVLPPVVKAPIAKIDLAQIKKRGRLLALTGYSASSYFVYRGQTMGFEYELLQLLAEHLNLDLEIVVANDLDNIFDQLDRGIGDIVAYNMTVTKSRLKQVSFTDHHTLIQQVLVQRMPGNWYEMKRHEIDQVIITNPVELIGKQVHVRKGSSYYHRLQHLSDEIGGDIDIVEVPGDVSTESLIAKVARGEIDYTVADENIAQINAAYHSNIDIRVFVSLPQRIAWAIRKNSPDLRNAINLWLKAMRSEPTFNVLYNKYHLNKRFYTQRVKSEFFSLTGAKISPYDALIQNSAARLNWDWRLLASQVYQESQFEPDAESWAGAKGLLQLMPATAVQYGAKNRSDPSQSLAAGTKFLRWLKKYWKEIPDSTERIKFVLASYNAGHGHVADARNLTIKYGKDPNIWEDNVAEFLLKKADERYFNDEVVRYGYCRGEEPVNYVTEILARYHQYQQFITN